MDMPENYTVNVKACDAQKMRRLCEEKGIIDKKRKICKQRDGSVSIPVLKDLIINEQGQDHEGSRVMDGVVYSLHQDENTTFKQPKSLSPQDKVLNAVEDLLQKYNIPMTDNLLKDIPRIWEKHDDLVVLHENAFISDLWSGEINHDLLKAVTSSLKCQRLAQKSVITSDRFRTPRVSLLIGDNGWVKHKDNGVIYSFDVTKCMFSAGNITEKLRVANFKCEGETVVDLYAGVGYFTLPYLVHAGASKLFACEWNPHAAEALKRNLSLNNVSDKGIVLEGDNREVCPKGVADRVNLGLIPSSENGWAVACAALKPDTGGILHIHGNVTTVVTGDLDCDTRTAGKDNAESVCSDSSTPDFSSTNSGGDTTKNFKFQKSRKQNSSWEKWACDTSLIINKLLQSAHSSEWYTNVLHIEHVKSYAPHVDHLVLDLECRPYNK